VAIHFKGSGFHNTDYGKKKTAATAGESKDGGESKSSDSSSSSSDSKSSDSKAATAASGD
jgi:hypothetical protein